MSVPERIGDIRRLFMAKLEKQGTDLEAKERARRARLEMDRVMGKSWRAEVKEAGFGMDPTGGACEEDLLPKALQDEGHQGLDVAEPIKKKVKHTDSILERLVKLLG